MMPIDLILVRHGQSEGNLAKRKSESGDHSVFTPEFLRRHSSTFRLSELGQSQAEKTGLWIKEEFCRGSGHARFDRYITSEYARAMETAGRMNLPDAKWYREVYLTERNWGELDSLPEHIRKEKFGEALSRREVEPFFWKPPNGESFLELSARVDRVLGTLHRECSDKRVLIVCHGEVMRAFQVRLERMTQARFKEMTFSEKSEERIHNCEVIHYSRRNPYNSELSKHADWVRHVRPAEDTLPFARWNDWAHIKRPTYSNQDLLDVVFEVSPMVTR